MRIWDRCANLTLLCIVGCLACMSSVSAKDVERELLGAWATSSSDCAKLFERHGDRWAYRQPINEFAQAAIIETGRILAPASTCEVRGVTRKNGVLFVSGMCRDSMSYREQTAQITVKGNNEIVYSPTGDSALNTDFQRCSP
jgi:hypothetical protein